MANNKQSIEQAKGHVTLSVDRSLLEQGLKAAQASFQSFGKNLVALGAGIGAAGAAVTVPMLGALSSFSSWGAELIAGTRRTGIEMERLGAIVYAMGGDMDAFGQSSDKLASFMQEAARGSATAAQALASLGLTFSELNAMDQHGRFLAVADALDKVADAGQRAALRRELLGRGSSQLNLSGGSAGIQQREQRAVQLGRTMSPEDQRIVVEYNLAYRELQATIQATWATLGATIAPFMSEFYRMITTIIQGVRDWINNNRELVAIVFRVADAMVTAGAVIVAIGGAFYAAGMAVSFFTPMLVAMSGALNIATAGMGIMGVASWMLSVAIGVVTSGFGILTAVQFAWGVGSASAAAIATAGMWLYNSALSAVTVISGLFAGSTVAADAGLASFGITEAIVAVETAILSGGLYLLVAAFGAVVIAVGAAVAALGGLAILGGLAAGISAMGVKFASLSSSLSFVDDIIDSIIETSKSVWDWIVKSPLASFVGMIRSVWDSIVGMFASIKGFMDETGLTTYLETLMNVALGFVGMAAGAVMLAGYIAYLGYQWVTTAGNIEAAWNSLIGMFSGGGGGSSFIGAWFDLWADGMKMIIGGIAYVANAITSYLFAPMIRMGQVVRDVASQAMEAARQMWTAFTDAAGKIFSALSNAFSRTVQAFSSMFTALVSTAGEAWGGITAAFNAGDMELVFEIVKTAGMLAWEELSNFAITTFNVWKDALIDSFNAAWDGLKDIFRAGWAFAQSGWYTMVAGLMRALKGPQEAIVALLDALTFLPGAGEGIGRASRRLNGINLEARARDAERSRDAAEEQRWWDDQVDMVERATREETAIRIRAERDQAAAEGHASRVAELQKQLDDMRTIAEGEADHAAYMRSLNQITPAVDPAAGFTPGGKADGDKATFFADAARGWFGAAQSPQDKTHNLLQKMLEKQDAEIAELRRIEGLRFA